MKRRTITIPAPMADKGDSVHVRNYRCRPPKWDTGVVTDLKYQKMHGDEFDWTYSVRVDRAGRYLYTLFVNDDAIERAR